MAIIIKRPFINSKNNQATIVIPKKEFKKAYPAQVINKNARFKIILIKGKND